MAWQQRQQARRPAGGHAACMARHAAARHASVLHGELACACMHEWVRLRTHHRRVCANGLCPLLAASRRGAGEACDAPSRCCCVGGLAQRPRHAVGATAGAGRAGCGAEALHRRADLVVNEIRMILRQHHRCRKGKGNGQTVCCWRWCAFRPEGEGDAVQTRDEAAQTHS